jgi:hypothetical protein
MLSLSCSAKRSFRERLRTMPHHQQLECFLFSYRVRIDWCAFKPSLHSMPHRQRIHGAFDRLRVLSCLAVWPLWHQLFFMPHHQQLERLLFTYDFPANRRTLQPSLHTVSYRERLYGAFNRLCVLPCSTIWPLWYQLFILPHDQQLELNFLSPKFLWRKLHQSPSSHLR